MLSIVKAMAIRLVLLLSRVKAMAIISPDCSFVKYSKGYGNNQPGLFFLLYGIGPQNNDADV